MLVLGVGVATGIFSVAQHMLLRPIPVPRLDRLVVAWETDPGRDGSLIEVSYPYFQEWRAQNRSFEDLAAYGSVNWSFEFKDSPRETVSAAFVSGSFFGTLRAQALHGRTFVPEDGGGRDVQAEPTSARRSLRLAARSSTPIHIARRTRRD